MQSNEIYILSTKPLDGTRSYTAGEYTAFIDSLAFIRTEPVINEYVKEAILYLSRLAPTVIFTSRNAVEVVITYLNGHQPEWKIFCIGNATKDIINRNFTNSLIAGTANNASVLAEVIVNSHVQSAVFFCGDQRREELPAILSEEGISLKEIVVYKTVLTPKKVEKEYDAILFFSPSAVKSFFSQNTVSEDSTLFATGNTTADCIRQHSSNKLVISNVSGKEALVEEAIFYFTKIEF